MTRLEFLLNQRTWCDTMMARKPEELPGVLTHDKVVALSIDTECELIDFERYTADGKMSYVDDGKDMAE